MIYFVLVLMKITNLIKNKLLDATRNNEKKKLLMAHQRRVRHSYQKKKVTNGAPEEGAPLLSEKKVTNGAPENGAPLL